MMIRPELLAATSATRRKGRYPVHNHIVDYRPWQIQPFMIAPVLAGETMKNLQLQARVISDPLATGFGNILPWWCEHHYFYVKLRDLNAAAVEAMMLTGTDLSALASAANPVTFHNGKGVDWMKLCYDFIVAEGGFRDDGEPANSAMIGNHYAASAIKRGSSWADSLTPAEDVIPDAFPDADKDTLQNPDELSELLESYYEQYQRMREMRVIDMDFEDWLKSYGVRLPQAVLSGKPERIRSMSQWAYPANTVDPETGVPTGVATWSISDRGDKDRFFHEPGFIVGVTFVRPKIYMGNQAQSAAHSLDNALAWAPRMLADAPHISIAAFNGASTGDTGMLKNQTNGFFVDMRDLFMYGDNFIATAAAAGFAPALPTAAGEFRYATAAMADALFASAEKNKIRQEGVTRLSVLGHVTTATDHT